MSSVLNSLTQHERWSAPDSLHNVATLGRLTESIAKELDESLSGIIINTSTCLRKLTDPSNVEGARETARRTIRDSMRAAEAVLRLRALFGEANKRIETVASSMKGSSRVAAGGTL
jgi:hypothetical protein